MALIRCSECSAEISDKALSCPKCGAPLAQQSAPRQYASPTADEKSSFPWWAWLFIVPIGLFALLLIVGANVSPERSKEMAREKAIDEMCAKDMADSALGTERRTARKMCDELRRKH